MEISKSRSAGLIYGFSPHYIDHLAPLCHLLNIPLIVTNEDIEKSLRQFYPKVQTHYIDYIHLPETVVSSFDLIFTCTPRILFDEIFFFSQRFHRKRVQTIWCPHGNSDKGHASPYMEALDKEDLSLVYGEKMIDFLKEKRAFNNLKNHVRVSNFRNSYYLENKDFYDNLVYETILSNLPKSRKNILYAPTWEDTENSSSFSSSFSYLIKNLPSDFNLIIKPHPNLLTEENKQNRSLIESHEGKPNILFLIDFPPIYPLLSIADIYVGDLSSIGYDFLTFNRPMFFLNEQKRNSQIDPGLYLYKCGVEIHPDGYENIYKTLSKEIPQDAPSFSKIRKETYDYTFGKDIRLTQLKQDIEAIL